MRLSRSLRRRRRPSRPRRDASLVRGHADAAGPRPSWTGDAARRRARHRREFLRRGVAAHAAGAVYVESDCHLTADGTVVLFHDPDLSRVTGDRRLVSEVATRELELLMAERGGLITLAQALDSFPETRFNLDVKAAGAADDVGRLVAPHAHRVLVTSFSDARRRAALSAALAAGPPSGPPRRQEAAPSDDCSAPSQFARRRSSGGCSTGSMRCRYPSGRAG